MKNYNRNCNRKYILYNDSLLSQSENKKGMFKFSIWSVQHMYFSNLLIPKNILLTLQNVSVSQWRSLIVLAFEPLNISTKWLSVKFLSNFFPRFDNLVTISTNCLAKSDISMTWVLTFLQLSQGATEDLHKRGSKTSPRY